MRLNTLKRAACLLLALALLCALLPQTAPAARAASYSGSCGDNLTWSFDSRSGTLTIEGSGDMYDYYYGLDAPWDAFSGSIKTASLPQGLTSVGQGAFISCDKLRSINIPDTVTRIGYSAFSWCESLEEITIPGSVTTIEGDAFSDCISLKSVTIPGSVTDFGEFAFEYCTGLSSVILEEGLTMVSAHAFQGCSSLTEIHFSKTVRFLDNYAFYGCSSLTEVTIPAAVTSLGSAVFGGCTGLLNYYVDENSPVYSAENGILFSKDGTILVLYPAGRAGSYRIPSSVSVIGDGAFDGCEALSAVTIPDSVTVIGRDAFSFCEGLTEIDIPSSVTSLGECAFEYCTALTEVTIPGSLDVISDFAFFACFALTDVTIPEGVTRIGDSAFMNCTGLAYATIPFSVTYIDDWAFMYCEKLTIRGYTGSTAEAFAAAQGFPFIPLEAELISGVCGDNLTWCFNPETGLLSIEGSGDMWDFGDLYQVPWSSFITNLKTVSLPDGLTHIGNFAFESCDALMSIVIPGSVDSIGMNAFYACSGLESVTFPEGLRVIEDQAFISCSSLTAVTLPESLEMVGLDAFRHCFALRQMAIRNPDCAICAAQECGARGIEYEVETEKTLGLPQQTVVYVLHDAEKENAEMFAKTLYTIWGPLVFGFRYAENYAKTYGYTYYALGTFEDVRPGKWYEIPVAWAYGMGITSGTGEGTFSPNDTCTREQIVTFLYAAAGRPDYSLTENPFTDVKAGKWYYDAVMWAYENGITSGVGDGLFGVGLGCTRAQVVSFLWNALGSPEPASLDCPFEDVAPGKYYYKPVLWAVENGITSGTGPSTFSPKDTCTRAQIVTFLYKAYAFPDEGVG